jgi:AI-2 transport protein TqsA
VVSQFIYNRDLNVSKKNDCGSSDFKIVNVTSWVMFTVLMVVILRNLNFLFIPLSISLLFCYALGLPLEFLKKLHVPPSLRIIIVVLFVLVSFYLLGRLVHSNVQEFQHQMPEFETKFWEYSNAVLAYFDISKEQAMEVFNSFWDNFKQADLKPIGVMVQKLGGSFFAFLGNVIWVLLFMIFILAEKENISVRLDKGLGKERSAPVQEAGQRINRAVQHYLGLKTLVSFITGVLVAFFLWLFGVHFALLWGVLAFLLNFIPNIGSLISTAPPVIITLFQYGSVSKALIVAVVIGGVQMGVGNFLEPKVMGRGLNLSPLVVLLSLVFWGWMWGMTGMLLSVPLTAAVKIALEQLDSTRPVAIIMSGN